MVEWSQENVQMFAANRVSDGRVARVRKRRMLVNSFDGPSTEERGLLMSSLGQPYRGL